MRRLTGLGSVISLTCAGLAVAACTPGTSGSARSVGSSASAAIPPAASAQPSGQASASGKGAGSPTAPAARPARWGSAFEVPGLNGLNAGLQAQVLSVSCPSPRNCAAGGFYADGSVAQQAFVVTEVSGHWGNAIAVPGTKSRNTGHKAQVSAVSCASAGNCAATGYYTDFASGFAIPFTAEEHAGVWGPAKPVPGIAALTHSASSNPSGDAQATAISCPVAGNCAIGGFYSSVAGGTPSFVATERNGSWGKAAAVSGTTAYQGTGQQLGLAAISCAAPGECAVGGTYTADSSGISRGFVATEASGHWGKARPVPGGSVSRGAAASSVTAMSCREDRKSVV